MAERRVFRQYDRVVFREGEAGPAEPGEVSLVYPPDFLHPNGGEYEIDLDDGSCVVAHWTEMTPEDEDA
jgi:hypothetical protein